MRTSGGKADSPGPPALPDFDLAPLEKIVPHSLVDSKTPTEVEKFFLALSLFYNDLKDMFWFFLRLRSDQEGATGVSGKSGQLAAMTNHLSRLVVGLLHELLRFLDEQRNTVLSSDLERLVSGLRPEGRKRWKELVDVAIDRKPDVRDRAPTTFPNALKRVRNRASYHCAAPARLAEGFWHHFGGTGKAEAEYAFFSDGHNAESTRFYYADAAIAGVVELETYERNSDWFGDVEKLAAVVNEALKPLLMAFIRSRMQAAGEVKQPKRREPKVGPNDQCPCGSDKKYKRCHGRLP